MLKIALLSTENSRSTRDLDKMISHLALVLKDLEGVEVDEVDLKKDLRLDSGKYNYFIFCGYDHVTLAHIHLVLSEEPSGGVNRIFLFDEPGASIERQLSSLIFQGIDYQRIPAGSASRLISSWSYRDIVGMARVDMVKLKDGQSTPEPAPDSGDAKPAPRSNQRVNRTRQVETKGKASARKRNETPSVGATPSERPEPTPE